MDIQKDISRAQILKDLEIENLSAEVQDTIIGSFFRGLEAKIKLEVIDGMTPEQQQEFAQLEDMYQDDYMEKSIGGDMDTFVDDMYKEHVVEFKSITESIAKGLQ